MNENNWFFNKAVVVPLLTFLFCIFWGVAVFKMDWTTAICGTISTTISTVIIFWLWPPNTTTRLRFHGTLPDDAFDESDKLPHDVADNN